MEFQLTSGQRVHHAGAVSSSGPTGGTYESDELDEELNGRHGHVVTARRVAARQRQVDIGKARPEYVRYLVFVPKEQRTPSRPLTPDPTAQVSKRAFDRQLSEWRRLLHEYDDPSELPEGDLPPSCRTSSSSSAGPPSQSQSLAFQGQLQQAAEHLQEAWGGYNKDSYQASMSSTAGAVAGSIEPNGLGVMKAPFAPMPSSGLQGSYRGVHVKPCSGVEPDGPPGAPSLHRRIPAMSSPEFEDTAERGSRLRASCREAATSPGYQSYLHSISGTNRDPTEPMKVYENSEFSSSEPMSVTPSFSGPTSVLRPSIQ